MYQGGVKINEKTAGIIRFASLATPVVLSIYSMFIQFGWADASHYAGYSIFYMIIIPWTILAVIHFLFASSSRFLSIVSLVLFHFFAMSYLLFVAGFTNPFIIGWILLAVATSSYFGRKGLIASVLTLVVAGGVETLITGTITLSDTVTIFSVIVTSLVVTSIIQVQTADSSELLRSKAHESLERDRILTIVNNLADAILSTDANGIIRIYNAASLNLLDTNTGLDGKHIDEVLTLSDADDQRISLLDDMQQSHSVIVRDDITMTIADETVRLEVTYSPIRSSYSLSKDSDVQDGYILILRDITKAKSLEEERDEFISVVSHELRTPITIAEGTISNVQLMMSRPNIAKKILQDAVTTAHDQVIFLAKMVNDLSTLSRAERGVADAEEDIDVKVMVNDLFGEYSPQAAKKGLHFNLDIGSHLGDVMASRLYLQELLQNFITNSIKYTKEGSVTLHAHRKNDIITFEVTDTGIGISKADQEKVFKKFYRSEDYRTRETGGTGLGLYVAVKLAKKLGTTIKLTSRLNHGSSFSFDLTAKTK